MRSFQKVMQLLESATEWEQESPAAPERLEIIRDLSPHYTLNKLLQNADLHNSFGAKDNWEFHEAEVRQPNIVRGEI